MSHWHPCRGNYSSRQCDGGVIWQILSSLWCYTVGRHRCILKVTHGRVTNEIILLIWHKSYKGPWWVSGQILHGYGTDRQFLGRVLCQEPVGQCVGRPIPLRRHSGFAARLAFTMFDTLALWTDKYYSIGQISWCICFNSKDKQCGSIQTAHCISGARLSGIEEASFRAGIAVLSQPV